MASEIKVNKITGKGATGGADAPLQFDGNVLTTATIANATISKINLSGTAPASPVAGDMYYDTTLNTLNIYNGTEWAAIYTPPAEGSGGTETTYTGYKIHTFLADGAFTVTGSTLTYDVLIVAGGGGGGAGGGGGGGAGGFRVLTGQTALIGSYTVNVGAGGDGKDSNESVVGDDGGNSSFNGDSATGGGGGAYNFGYGSTGGSGGAGGGNGSQTPGAGNAGSYSPVEGYVGGYGGTSPLGRGGGGGAGGAGVASSGTNSGNGGVGLQNNYRTGSDVWYAGGGGGGSDGRGSAGRGIGGNGGGGDGGDDDVTINVHAEANTGGGGGGSGMYGDETIGGNGGSGIVVIRYAI